MQIALAKCTYGHLMASSLPDAFRIAEHSVLSMIETPPNYY